MERSVLLTRVAAGAVLLTGCLLVLGGIRTFGIWDPWELNAADIARRIAEGNGPELQGAPLGPWLVAQGFAIFGVHEWSGRVPVALTGLLTMFASFGLLARFAGIRTGIYAALVTTTTPLFLMNAQQMVGAAPGFLGATAVFGCASSLVFHPKIRGVSENLSRIVWAIGLLLAVAFSISATGVMVGVLPALGAVAAVAVARGELAPSRFAADPPRYSTAAILGGLTAIAALQVVWSIAGNAASYSLWIGGTPRGGNPPTFEVVLEQVFHSFAPWSALIPLAMGRAFAGRGQDELGGPDDADASALRLALPLWAVLGFCAQTVFLSRFGTIAFLPVVGLAGSIAFFLRDSERARSGSWAAGLVVLLLSALLIRDFVRYPVVPATGLPIDGLTAPEHLESTLSRGWAALLALFGLCALLGLARDRSEDFDSLERDLTLRDKLWAARLGRPARIALGITLLGTGCVTLREQWNRGVGFRLWMLAAASLAAGFTLFGALCWILPEERPTDALAILAQLSLVLAIAGLAGLIFGEISLARRGPKSDSSGRLDPARVRDGSFALVALAIPLALSGGILAAPVLSSLVLTVGRVLALVVPGIVVAVAVSRGVRYLFHWMGESSLLPMLITGLVIGGFVSFGFQRLMSAQFSPREVYNRYNQLASAGEVLGEYRVNGRAAPYYANGETRELEGQPAVLDFLDSSERVWLAFRADDLSSLNRAYRTRTGRHLFVAEANTGQVLLATNRPVEGLENGNYLASAVLDAVPNDIQHRVQVDFDRRIELVGYDLTSSSGETVGPGREFTITWYWQVRAAVPGNYQIFLHIDGAGQRINGDHEPVDEHYPVRLWAPGDVVVDRQTLTVPPNFPPGDYTIYVGFFAGNNRLDVVSGPADDVDRAMAGTLHVR